MECNRQNPKSSVVLNRRMPPRPRRFRYWAYFWKSFIIWISFPTGACFLHFFYDAELRAYSYMQPGLAQLLRSQWEGKLRRGCPQSVLNNLSRSVEVIGRVVVTLGLNRFLPASMFEMQFVWVWFAPIIRALKSSELNSSLDGQALCHWPRADFYHRFLFLIGQKILKSRRVTTIKIVRLELIGPQFANDQCINIK